MNGCVLSLLLTLVVWNCGANDVTVTSKAGTFIGFQDEVSLFDKNATITKFLGIPYAEPPIGDLRFRKPVAKAPLQQPLEVKKFGSACLQFYFMFQVRETDSEDCLFLNIFKPDGTKSDEKLPVMVWIYGGSFVMGTSIEYVGDALAANGPVIVVTLNYRLSVWGFLSTGNKNAPGNYGLWDQHLAIKWVHDNIEAFGGDSKKVTIFGESAGSASVIYQGMYPGNKGLFQRIIAQSGSPLAQWARTDGNPADTIKLASNLECETEDEIQMLECLRNVPTNKINNTINNRSVFLPKVPMPFIPNVDGEFVSIVPRKATERGNKEATEIQEGFASFDLMTGINSGEGGGAVSPMYGFKVGPEDFLPNKTYFDKTLVPIVLKTFFGEDYSPVMEDIVISEYTDWNEPENPQSIRQQYCDMHGDFLMLGGSDRTVKIHASFSKSRTFYYWFDILPYKSIFPRSTWYNKARHVDDLLYVFGDKMDLGLKQKRDFQAWEKEASNNIMTLWTNFAKTGNPNEPRFVADWKPFTPCKHYYLHIMNDVTSSKSKERLRERQAILVDTILPEIYESRHCNKNKYSGKETCSRYGNCPRN